MMDRRALANFWDSVDWLDMDLQPEGCCGWIATNLAAHLPTKPNLQSHQSHYLATNLLPIATQLPTTVEPKFLIKYWIKRI